MDEEEEGEQVYPQEAQEVPIDPCSVQSDGVTGMDDPLQNPHPIDHQVGQSKRQMEQVNEDEDVQITRRGIGSTHHINADVSGHQNIICSENFSSGRAIIQRDPILCNGEVLAPFCWAIDEVFDAVPTVGFGTAGRLIDGPSHAFLLQFFPALPLHHAEPKSQRKGDGEVDEAGLGFALFHGPQAEVHGQRACDDQGVADPQGPRRFDVNPVLAHVGYDVGRRESCKKHDDGEEDEVHQHLLGAVTDFGIQSFEYVHAPFGGFLCGFFAVHDV